jgi:hypothetical protein
MGYRQWGSAVRAMTARYTGSGDTVWTRERVPGVPVAAVAVDTFGVVHTDYAADSSTLDDIKTFSHSPDGNLRWVSRYDGPAHLYDDPLGITADPARASIYVTGYSRGVGTGFDGTTLCYDFAGGLRWLHRYCGEGGAGHDKGQAICLDVLGNVIVAGYETRAHSGTDWLVIKYPPTGPGVTENSLAPVVPEPMLSVSPTVVSRLCRLAVHAGIHQANLIIADITGRTVRGVPVPPGVAGDRVSVTWDTRDEHGQLVPNGVYFVALAPGSTRSSCKVIAQR